MDEDSENVPYLEITEVVLLRCKTFGQLLDISPKNFTFLKNFCLRLFTNGLLIKLVNCYRQKIN